MRGIFGLVGLLMVCGVIALVWGKGCHPADTARKGMDLQNQAKDIQGRDFLETVDFEPHEQNGKQWVDVTRVDPGGPAATYYGLMVGDRIVQFGQTSVEAIGAGNAALMIVDAYRHPTEKQPLIVIRNSQKLKLPGATPVP